MRDVLRWCEFIEGKSKHFSNVRQEDSFRHESTLMNEGAFLFFISRLRTAQDRKYARDLFEDIFGFPMVVNFDPPLFIQNNYAIVGLESIFLSPLGFRKENFRIS